MHLLHFCRHAFEKGSTEHFLVGKIHVPVCVKWFNCNSCIKNVSNGSTIIAVIT